VPLAESMATIIKVLSTGPYMLGERFSAVDVLYGTTFAMFAQSQWLPNRKSSTSTSGAW
jgi:glutathione S-transferase